MKNKAKTPTPSTTIIIDSNNSSSIGSKNISFVDNKKEYKYISRLNKKQKNRQINSLDELTKKFAKCVYNSPSDKINLNNVMKRIKAKKRRIYDITNVLEGEYIYTNI
jgi:sulfite reductase alpha subunit-like flavoprotein